MTEVHHGARSNEVLVGHWDYQCRFHPVDVRRQYKCVSVLPTGLRSTWCAGAPKPQRGAHRTLPPVTGRVFRRSLDPDLPVAVEARGSTIRDAAGREYLDAAGGAIVVNVGHGRASIARVLGEQAARLAYAHGSAFTTEPLEAYAAEIGPHLPVDDPAIYPVSGGSEAIETALKLAAPTTSPAARRTAGS